MRCEICYKETDLTELDEHYNEFKLAVCNDCNEADKIKREQGRLHTISLSDHLRRYLNRWDDGI